MKNNLRLWHGKRVLITGHTGFKGSWLCIWLQRLGAILQGVALQPNTSPSLFGLAHISKGMDSKICDIRDASALSAIIHSFQPEIVFHLAAQPLVRMSYDQPIETFSTNIMGTAHVLDALRETKSARVAVMVTTDKVYGNQEWPYPYRESDALGGHDPYSSSKAASEMIIDCYRKSFLSDTGIAVATARSGNVIGGGDWSKDRIIPDAVKAWQDNKSLEIRRPDAIRPWQHVLEPLAGYLSLAQALWHKPEVAGAYNFGPQPQETATVRDLVQLARQAYGKGEVRWHDVPEGPHEAGTLSLEVVKAKSVLGHVPRWNLQEAIFRTMRWHLALSQGQDARSLCEADISEYEQLLS